MVVSVRVVITEIGLKVILTKTDIASRLGSIAGKLFITAGYVDEHEQRDQILRLIDELEELRVDIEKEIHA